MSDVNVLVWHWDEVTVLVAVWLGLAASVGSIVWKWRGWRWLLWWLAGSILGPPVLVLGVLAAMIVAKG